MCSLMFSSNTGSLGPLFLQIFLPASTSLLFLDRISPSMSMLACLMVSYRSLRFTQLLYSVVFLFLKLYHINWLKFTDSFFCLFRLDLEAPEWSFYFKYCTFRLKTFYLVLTLTHPLFCNFLISIWMEKCCTFKGQDLENSLLVYFRL